MTNVNLKYQVDSHTVSNLKMWISDLVTFWEIKNGAHKQHKEKEQVLLKNRFST